MAEEANVKMQPAAKAKVSAPVHEPRRSDRIHLRVGVQVSAIDVHGQTFVECTHTQTLSRNGASLILRRMVSARSEFTVQFGQREARMRIIGQVGIVEEGHVYGATFVEAQQQFWNITFPQLTNVDDAVARLLLRCTVCARREIMHLDEVETAVYEANWAITRACEVCRTDTLWQLADESDDEAHVPVVVSTAAATVPNQPGGKNSTVPLAATIKVPSPHRGASTRKYPRLRIPSAKACIRRHSFPDDIGNVVDLSRGGVRFRSPTIYQVGSWVQVAVPYTLGSGNIFVSGRLIRVQVSPMEDQPGEYAIQYSANQG